MSSLGSIGTEQVRVRVGTGSKAHLFRPRDGANAKVFTLREGGTAHDYVLCGASGSLRQAKPDLDDCLTCRSVVERSSESSAASSVDA